MKTTPHRIIAGLPAFLPLALFAQQEGEEIVTLSPFEVDTDAVRGYATTSSLGASRIAVPITEIKQSVFTINQKLIEDTAALDLRDTLNFVANANNIGGRGNDDNQFSKNQT